MYKVHRLVERRTTLNSRKWENNKTFNNLVNYNTCNTVNSQLRITNNINKKEIACFSLDGKHIKTFENIKQAAYEYFASVSIISKCIKNNKPFRGIIYWKRI